MLYPYLELNSHGMVTGHCLVTDGRTDNVTILKSRFPGLSGSPSSHNLSTLESSPDFDSELRKGRPDNDLILEGVVCVYLDDILVFTKMLEEHHRIGRLVLERL